MPPRSASGQCKQPSGQDSEPRPPHRHFLRAISSAGRRAVPAPALSLFSRESRAQESHQTKLWRLGRWEQASEMPGPHIELRVHSTHRSSHTVC